MFCMKCGAKLEDGAKFCPQCGAAQTPAAPESGPAPASPQVGGPAQPHRSSTSRQQAAPSPQPGYAAPTRQAAYAPDPQPYAPAPQPKKKKKHTGLVIFLILILAIAAGAYVMRDKISSYALRSFAPPEKYYQHVEKLSIAEFGANAAEAYDTLLLANTDVDNQTSDGGLELRLGSAGRDLIMGALGSTLQQLNPSEDLAWLQSLSIEGGRVTQGDLTSMQMKLLLNGTGLVTLNLTADTAADKLCLSIPELKSDYLEMPLSQLEAMSGGSGMGSIIGMVGGMMSADNEKMAEALRSMPDKATLEKLIEKYLNLILDYAEEVDKDTEDLSVEGVKVEVTALEITADGPTLAKALESVYTEMKKDADIKSIIINTSKARDEDGNAAYQEFLKSLDESLEELDQVRSSDGFTMTVYTDAGGEVLGRELHTDGFDYVMKFPQQGDKFGLEILLGEGENGLHLKGKGTKSGDKLTGELDMESGGSFLGILALEGLDKEKLKQGSLSGAIEIRPSDAMMNAGEGESTLTSLLRNLVIRLDMDTARNKGSITLTILSDGSSLLSLTGRMNAKSGGRVSPVTGSDMEQWSADLAPNDFLNTLVDSLKRAGVPEAYTSQIPTGE